MTVELIGVDDLGRSHFKGLAADPRPNGEAGSTYIITDGNGGEEKYYGPAAGWKDPNPHQAGERGADDPATSYLEGVESGIPISPGVIGTTETVIAAYPCILVSITPNAGHSGNVALRNAAATGGGSTPIITPTIADDGTPRKPGTVFSTGLTAQGGGAACNVTFVVKAIKS